MKIALGVGEVLELASCATPIVQLQGQIQARQPTRANANPLILCMNWLRYDEEKGVMMC